MNQWQASSTYVPSFVTWTTGILAIGIVITTLLTVVRAYLPIPLFDQWEEVTASDHVARLFSPHNEHVIFFPRLLFIVDKKWFAGSNKFNQLMTFVIQFIHAGMIWLLAKGAKLPPKFCAGVIFAALFWLYQYENFIIGFQVQFVGVCALATAAFAAMGFMRELGVWAAIALALMATFTMSNGLLVGLLLIPLALCLGLPRRSIAFLSTSAAVAAVIYVALHRSSVSTSMSTPVTVGNLLKSLAQPGNVLMYIGTYLGAPFGRLLFRGDIRSKTAVAITATIGFCGLCILLAAVAAILRGVRLRPERGTAELVLIYVALFAVTTALVTALGRTQASPISQAGSARYGTVALIFWLCLLLLIWDIAMRWQPKLFAIPAATGVLACLVMAASQPFIMRMILVSPPNRLNSLTATEQLGLTMRWELAQRQAAVTAMLAGVYDQDAFRSIYPRPHELPDKILKLRAAHMAPFNEPWSQWFGAALPSSISISAESCRGDMDSISAINRGAWKVGGWGIEVGGGSYRRIVLLSDKAIVIGYGLRLPGNTLTEALIGANAHWRGDVSASSGSTITAYALDSSGKSVCPIGSARLESSPAF